MYLLEATFDAGRGGEIRRRGRRELGTVIPSSLNVLRSLSEPLLLANASRYSRFSEGARKYLLVVRIKLVAVADFIYSRSSGCHRILASMRRGATSHEHLKTLLCARLSDSQA